LLIQVSELLFQSPANPG